jgi:hypothetical protein
MLGGLQRFRILLDFLSSVASIAGSHWAARRALVEILAEESLEGVLVRSGDIVASVGVGGLWGF